MELRPLTLDQMETYARVTCFRDGACWCAINQYPSMTGDEWDLLSAGEGPANRAKIEACLARGVSPGALVYEGEILIGWCGFGRLTDFPRFAHRADQLGATAASTACIICFALLEPHRRQGKLKSIIKAVVARARTEGFAAIEAYPFPEEVLATPDGHERTWMGYPAVFGAAGFTPLEQCYADQPGRHIYRLELT